MPVYDPRKGRLIGAPPRGGEMKHEYNNKTGKTDITTACGPSRSSEKDMEAIFAKELSGDVKNPKSSTPAQIAKKAVENRKKKEAKKAKKLLEKAEELEMLNNLEISDSKDSEGVVKK